MEDLRRIWADLVPETQSPATLPDDSSEIHLPFEKSPRAFRGEELTNQQAGYVFERWVTESFRLSSTDLKVERSYTVPMDSTKRAKEEHDGLMFHGWQGFLIQSKFTPGTPVNFEPIAKPHVQVERRPIGSLGLFFSAFGFTAPALELAKELRPIRVLLFNATDLAWAMGENHSIFNLLLRKWQAAVQYGTPNFVITDEFV